MDNQHPDKDKPKTDNLVFDGYVLKLDAQEYEDRWPYWIAIQYILDEWCPEDWLIGDDENNYLRFLSLVDDIAADIK